MKITASKFPERAELGPLPCSDNPGLLYLHLHTARAPLTPMTPAAKPSREEAKHHLRWAVATAITPKMNQSSPQNEIRTVPAHCIASTSPSLPQTRPRRACLLFAHFYLHHWHLSHPRRSTSRIEVLFFRRSSDEGETKREVFLCAKEGREEGAACIKHQPIPFGRDCQCL